MNMTGSLSPDNTALLLIDHQTGLMNGVADQSQTDLRNNVLALAKLGKMFKLPTVLTTSFVDGPNGPPMQELTELFPAAPIIHRPGEINAWDNPEFVDAVKNTGRQKLLMAGISPDVCLAFAALSAKQDGFEVYAVLDASGTWNKDVAEAAKMRMVQAGIIPINWMAVSAELQNDWRNETGQGLAEIYREHLPFYGNVMCSFAAASEKG